MRGHVFVVNENTLPKHLNYLFVGVSAGDNNNNISLLSDMLRVKKDDYIFFYIEGTQFMRGKFFGIFKAKDNFVYHLVDDNAYQPNLNVKLIYRKEILPFKVYPMGVFEWIALDKLPIYSREILWTLIYRKMKGKRGNTMLFPWECEKLISLIQDENQGLYLTGNYFNFNLSNYEIILDQKTLNHNIGNCILIDNKKVTINETYFQAYILQNLQVENNVWIPQIFGKNIIWLGNEVFAGSGMQKIDILIIEKIDENEKLFRIIELKHPKSTINVNYVSNQLEYYINWAREDIGGHLIGCKKFNVKPILVVLTDRFNSVPINVINNLKNLSNISNEPEIWEIDFNFNQNKIL